MIVSNREKGVEGLTASIPVFTCYREEGVEGLTASIPVSTCCESCHVLSALFESSGGKQLSTLSCLSIHVSFRVVQRDSQGADLP